MTIPNGGPLLRPLKRRITSSPSDLILDEPYLLSFGELHVPRDVWHAIQRFSVWVEPDRRRVAASDARVRRDAGPPARRGADGRSDDVVGADPGRAARARSHAGAARAGERDALRVERQAADERESRHRSLLPVVRVAVQ